MIDIQLENIDPEEIEDVLRKVESSFDIKFVGKELIHITTFGELCDHITNKIELDNLNDCTSQQAFYKLRNAISSTLQLDSKIILTDLPLSEIFPNPGRQLRIKKLESQLGFKLNLLTPPKWAISLFSITFLISLVGIFFNWQAGLAGILISSSGFWVANKISNELSLKTLRQVVEKMTRENYLKCRRNSKRVNKKEIEKVLTSIFSYELDLDKSKLTREAKFL